MAGQKEKPDICKFVLIFQIKKLLNIAALPREVIQLALPLYSLSL